MRYRLANVGGLVGAGSMIAALTAAGMAWATPLSRVHLSDAVLISARAEQNVGNPLRPARPTRPPSSQVHNQSYSANWAGFIDGATTSGASLASDGASFTSAGAAWTVPVLESSAPNAYEASWAGIGGVFGDAYLVQAGTIEDSSGPTQQYVAFVEDYPNPPLEVEAPVRPGDAMTASVSRNGSSWSVDVTDATSGWTTGDVDISATYESDGYSFYSPDQSSAEWVVEDPACGTQLCAFADFGPEEFSSASDQAATAVTRTPVESILVSPQGVAETSVSPASIGSSSAETGTYQDFSVTRIDTNNSPAPPSGGGGPGGGGPQNH